MLKSAVRFRFPKGAKIKDPEMLFNACLESHSVCAIDLHEGEEVPEAALKALLRAASKYPAGWCTSSPQTCARGWSPTPWHSMLG
jgi:hypothetical protein